MKRSARNVLYLGKIGGSIAGRAAMTPSHLARRHGSQGDDDERRREYFRIAREAANDDVARPSRSS